MIPPVQLAYQQQYRSARTIGDEYLAGYIAAAGRSHVD